MNLKAYRLPLMLLTCLALPVWLLGAWGFWTVRAEGVNHFFDALYRSLQLFALQGGDHKGYETWQVQVARFIAPASTLTVVVSFLQSFVLACRHQAARMLWCDHDIICGLGELGMTLLRDLRKRGRSVIVIDAEVDNSYIEEARRLGAIVLHGNAREDAVLKGAAIHRARSAIITVGKDDDNVAVTLRVIELAKKRAMNSRQWRRLWRSAPVQPLIACPHLMNRETRNMLRDQVDVDLRSRIEVRDFSKYELAARSLFRKCPLDGNGIRPESTTRVHLVIIGFGKMGRAVLLQGLRLGQFANETRLAVSIFDYEAKRKYECFCGSFPNLSKPEGEMQPIADIETVDGEVVSVAKEKRLEQIVTEAAKNDTQVLVVIAADSDVESLKIAQHLPQAFAENHVRVCVRMRAKDGVSRLIRNQRAQTMPGDPARPRYRAFGELESFCHEQDIIAARQDELAQAIHQAYLNNLLPAIAEDQRKRQHKPWKELAEEFRESSRQAADFIPVLLRSCGYRVLNPNETRGANPALELSPNEVEIMAKLEHARWYAERFLAGWTYAPQRNDECRQHNNMVPWDKLDKNVKDIDRNQVRNYVKLVSITRISGEALES